MSVLWFPPFPFLSPCSLQYIVYNMFTPVYRQYTTYCIQLQWAAALAARWYTQGTRKVTWWCYWQKSLSSVLFLPYTSFAPLHSIPFCNPPPLPFSLSFSQSFSLYFPPASLLAHVSFKPWTETPKHPPRHLRSHKTIAQGDRARLPRKTTTQGLQRLSAQVKLK